MNLIHDLVNPETGKTYKQENLEKVHLIPLKELVELENGVRLYVIGHIRDCDGTPLYRLGIAEDQKLFEDEAKGSFNSQAHGNYNEESLTVI